MPSLPCIVECRARPPPPMARKVTRVGRDAACGRDWRHGMQIALKKFAERGQIGLLRVGPAVLKLRRLAMEPPVCPVFPLVALVLSFFRIHVSHMFMSVKGLHDLFGPWEVTKCRVAMTSRRFVPPA